MAHATVLPAQPLPVTQEPETMATPKAIQLGAELGSFPNPKVMGRFHF